jgi:hypothetical protein
LTAPETLVAIDGLLEEYTDAEVAEQLHQQGYRTFDGLLFQSMHVSQLRRHHHIPDRYTRLRAQGMLTAEELGRNLGVSAQVMWRRYHQAGFMRSKKGQERETNPLFSGRIGF